MSTTLWSHFTDMHPEAAAISIFLFSGLAYFNAANICAAYIFMVAQLGKYWNC